MKDLTFILQWINDDSVALHEITEIIGSEKEYRESVQVLIALAQRLLGKKAHFTDICDKQISELIEKRLGVSRERGLKMLKNHELPRKFAAELNARLYIAYPPFKQKK